MTKDFLAFASSAQQKIVKDALPAKRTMRVLCDHLNNKHPGMSGADMARVLATMGFNYFTACTVTQEWRRARNMKVT